MVDENTKEHFVIYCVDYPDYHVIEMVLRFILVFTTRFGIKVGPAFIRFLFSHSFRII